MADREVHAQFGQFACTHCATHQNRAHFRLGETEMIAQFYQSLFLATTELFKKKQPSRINILRAPHSPRNAISGLSKRTIAGQLGLIIEKVKNFDGQEIVPAIVSGLDWRNQEAP